MAGLILSIELGHYCRDIPTALEAEGEEKYAYIYVGTESERK